MTKQKVGLVIFWIGVIWAILWGVLGSIFAHSALNSLSPAELSQSIWSMTGPLFMVYGVLGPTLGAIVAVIGLLLYSGAKGSTVWKFGIGVSLAYFIGMSLTGLGRFPPIFGIGGTLILLSFIGILWLWAKERIALKGSSTTATDFRMVGYVFIFIAAWFICALAARPFLKGLEELPQSSPIHIMISFVLGFIFLFLSHYKSRQ